MFADGTRERFLVVRLADLGDLLLAEPAMRSLRAGFPEAIIDLLVPPSSAALARIIAPDARIISFPKQAFDQISGMLNPHNARMLAALATSLRSARYTHVVLLHHLTTELGARKFRALCSVTGAENVIGLENGRGSFLTACVEDLGFGARHEADYALDVAIAAGGDLIDPRPTLTATGTSYFADLPDSYIAVYPVTGAYSSARTWPISGYADVVWRLIERGHHVVVVGGPDARQAGEQLAAVSPNILDLTGRTSLEELVDIVAGAQAIVGGDSFIGHLGAALGRPLVAIFGPANIDAWRPYGSTIVPNGRDIPRVRSIALTADVPCGPCLYTGFSLGRRDGCPARTCLQLLTPQRVCDAIDAVMAADNA